MLLTNAAFTSFAGARSTPDFVSSNYATANSTSVTVTAPTGIQDGMLLVLLYEGTISGTPTLTVPSGFTNAVYIYNSGGIQFVCRTKIASSESGNYTVSSTGSAANIAASVLVYRGVTGYDSAGSPLSASTTPSLAAPSFTPTNLGTLIYVGGRPSSTGSSALSSDPSGMTQRVGQTFGSNGGMYVYDQPNVPGGVATGTRTLTLAANGSSSFAGIFQIY